MPRYFAFLRAINVGGHNVKMEQLRVDFESLGFTRVETFIASGNVIFESKSTAVSALEAKIEARLRESLGYDVVTFLRTDKEMQEISSYKQCVESDLEQSATLCVGFLQKPLSDEALIALTALTSDIDKFRVHNREVYWLTRVGQRESTFSNAVLERLMKGKSTFRNINTVLRLVKKYF